LEHNGVELISDEEIAVWNGMCITRCAVSELYGVRWWYRLFCAACHHRLLQSSVDESRCCQL